MQMNIIRSLVNLNRWICWAKLRT